MAHKESGQNVKKPAAAQEKLKEKLAERRNVGKKRLLTNEEKLEKIECSKARCLFHLKGLDISSIPSKRGKKSVIPSRNGRAKNFSSL